MTLKDKPHATWADELDAAVHHVRLAKLDSRELPAALDRIIAIIRTLRRGPEPRGIQAPSHLTPHQARQILSGMSKQGILYHMRPGGALEPETHHGVRVIPAWKVMRFQDAREART